MSIRAGVRRLDTSIDRERAVGYENLAIRIENDDAAVPFAKRRPSRVLERALAGAPETRPAVLAEYWHLLVTGAHHDPVYALAVALDARGAVLTDPPGLLAESLAAAARSVPRESRWRIAETPAAAGALELALGALKGLPGDLDFVRGWALVVLRDLLADAGHGNAARRLAEDLSDRLDARRHTLRQLAGTARVHGFGAPRHDTVRRWRLPCDFAAGRGELPFFVGCPAPGFHPLHFQAAWARERRDGEIPPAVMARVQELASD